MKALDYLKQLETWDTIIQNKLAEKDQWKLAALSITARSDGERVQSTGNQQKMADAVSRCIDLEREIDECIDKLTDRKREAIRLLDQLAYKNRKHYDILHKMYIGVVIEKADGTYHTFRWDCAEIATFYGKSYSWATSTHGRALQSFQRIMDAEKRPKV